MKAQFINENLFGSLFETIDINVDKRHNVAIIYLDTIDWPSIEQAHDDIYNLHEYLLSEINEELLPEYKIDLKRLSNMMHNVEFIDSYNEDGEEHEIWSIELPVTTIV